jgi:hypothetical protein
MDAKFSIADLYKIRVKKLIVAIISGLECPQQSNRHTATIDISESVCNVEIVEDRR